MELGLELGGGDRGLGAGGLGVWSEGAWTCICGLESVKKQRELVHGRACVRGTLCELKNLKILIAF